MWCRQFTSEDLMVVLQQRLEASTLLLQELQCFLLHQTCDLAYGEAAWPRRGGRGGKDVKVK